MLVVKKEVKLGLGIAGAVLGIAAVYGLMATLSTSNRTSAPAPDSVATVDVTSGDQIVTGLPPRDETGGEVKPFQPDVTHSGDPFVESTRTQAKANTDWSATMFSTGRVPVDATPAVGSPVGSGANASREVVSGTSNVGASALSSDDAPIVTRTPVGTGDATSNAPVSASGIYVILPGDNYSRIAGKLYGNKNLYKVIAAANPELDPTKLRPGMKINVPAADTVTAAPRNSIGSLGSTEIVGTIDTTREYRVQAGDTLHRISQRLYGKSNQWAAVYDLNKELIGPDAGKLKIGVVLKLPQAPVR